MLGGTHRKIWDKPVLSIVKGQPLILVKVNSRRHNFTNSNHYVSLCAKANRPQPTTQLSITVMKGQVLFSCCNTVCSLKREKVCWLTFPEGTCSVMAGINGTGCMRAAGQSQSWEDTFLPEQRRAGNGSRLWNLKPAPRDLLPPARVCLLKAHDLPRHTISWRSSAQTHETTGCSSFKPAQ